MKKIVIPLLLAVAAIIVSLLFLMKGPDVSVYEPLREPRITEMKDRKMLVVKASGDPNAMGKKAFGLLFKAYHKMEGVPRGPDMPPPRARWIGAEGGDKSRFTGLYAMPVPGTATALPSVAGEPGITMELALWHYGTVAEILHVGPYDRETPAIRRLLDFIAERGYVVAGKHEEEYVRGPGMFFRGDPEKYYTIIRYQVRKK